MEKKNKGLEEDEEKEEVYRVEKKTMTEIRRHGS